MKQLRGGADFAKLVAQYSEDAASKAAGGDFGVIKAVSEYPAELKSAVFALKPGEISEPIRQPTAYYIVRLEEKGTQPVDEVREPIVQALRNEHMNQWMKDMNASYQAVIKDPDFFKAPAAARSRRADPTSRAGSRRMQGVLPPLSGRPIRVELRRSLGPHLAATHIPRRVILLDAGLLAQPGEFERILVHEIFHFAWVRLSNQTRRSWEGVLAAELAARVRGRARLELGMAQK